MAVAWPGLRILAAYALGLASSATTLASRSTVNFDFGWRFAASAEQRFEAQCSFEENMNFGQGSIWAGPTASKEECCSECANRELCMSWDWNGHLCYNKDNAVGAKAEHGRWSGRLGSSFTKNASFAWPGDRAVPVQAQLAYDDSSWEVVDAPHDFGRERMETCLGGGRRRLSDESDGALTAEPIRPMQNCSGFYRKHFSLPAAWRGGVTYVYFEGVYHNSAMWLNGKPLDSFLKNETETQWAWMEKELAAAQKASPHVIVVSHHPPFLKAADEKHVYWNWPMGERNRLLGLLSKYGVKNILCGHTHTTTNVTVGGLNIFTVAGTARAFDNNGCGYRVLTINSTDVSSVYVRQTDAALKQCTPSLEHPDFFDNPSLHGTEWADLRWLR